MAKQVKKDYVQLLHRYVPNKYNINGWFVSTKLDGIRCIWDGGVSRGELASSVPWANVEKDSRLRETVFATGLWSRMGNVVKCPDWFLDRLPNFPLDGELWMGHRTHQKVASTIKTHSGSNWKPVQYMIFDSPPLETFAADRIIDIRMGKILYKVKISGGLEWIKSRGKVETVKVGMGFESVYNWLSKKEWNENICLHKQTQLPFSTPKTVIEIEELLEKALEEGAEGLVLRSHIAGWKTERTHSALKFKPYDDDEGIVLGYKWGRRTELGSKLMGKMGALTVGWQGKMFDLSGFTEEERTMIGPNVLEEGTKNEGKVVNHEYYAKYFPRGTTITFSYRDFTDSGLPKEARYRRVREIE